MVMRRIRIGSLPDVIQYDDADYNEAIETDQPIKAGTPSDPTDVLRLSDIGGTVGNVLGPGASTDNAIARFNGASGKYIQNSSVLIDDNGTVYIPVGQVLKIGGNQVVGTQQAVEADIAAVPNCTGTDTINQATLESYLGNIRTTVNSLLSKLRTHGLINT